MELRGICGRVERFVRPVDHRGSIVVARVRSRLRGRSLVRALILLPLVLPPVVGGLALLYTFGRQGLLGHQLEMLGVRIAFSTTAVVLAQTFVSLPFLVLSLEGALRTAGQGYEQVAATLGAGPTTVLRTVTVPPSMAFAAEPSDTPALVAISRIGLWGISGSVSKVKMTRKALADPMTSWPDPTGSCTSFCLPVIKT